MKTVVIYKSKTGFTKQYAQWISEALSCKAVDYKDRKKLDLQSFDLVIFGGRLIAGKIEGLQKIKQAMGNKIDSLVVFATGATPNTVTEEIERVRQNNFGGDSIPFFYMQSGLCYEKMGFFEKTMMKMFAKTLESKQDKTEVEKNLAAIILKSHDMSDKSYIEPLIDYVTKTYRQ
jgi:menaquinone-dependent protoporphyrinogen IX oxidase